MIIYVAVTTAFFSILVLALVYRADLWEPEPLDLLQNAFLVGLGAQLVLVLAGHRLAALEAWSGGLYALTLGTFAVALPTLLAAEEEVDERFDGVVYGVAFAAGAASVVHLFNLPRAAARHPELVVLGASETPGVRDLLLLVSASGPRRELGDLLALLLIAALAGAVLGTLKLRGLPLIWQIGGTLAAALALAAIELAADGWWPVRLVFAVAAAAAAVVLLRRSVHRHRRPPAERQVFLGALKTSLVICGAILVTLTLLMSLTDVWEAAAAAESLPPAPGRPDPGAFPR